MRFYRVETIADAEQLIREMPDVIAIDTEYIKGDPRTTQLLSVIIADTDRAWAVTPSLLPRLTPCIQARKLIFLQNYNHCDTIILLKNGCDLNGTDCHNLIDMHHLLDGTADHSLNARCRDEFNDDYKTVFWEKYKNYEDAPPEEQLEYACKDAIYTYRLGIEDLTEFDDHEDDKLWTLYEHVRKLSKALLDTELQGVRVNQQLMQTTKDEMSKQISQSLPKLRGQFNEYCTVWELEKWQLEIDKRTSERGKILVPRPEFTFTSDKQVSWLVYEALKCPVIGKTKSGNPSTDYETLQTLSLTYPELQGIVEYKDLKSVYSTFVEGMLERVQNGRIYPHFNVSGTATGRISHSDPNMGNLPKSGVIRNFFIPSEGMVLVGADYEQLEVVVELNLTEDPGLKEIVCGGVSKHDLFMDELHKAGFPLERGQVKNVNFALQYDAQAKKISKMVGCSEQDAERIIDVFYTKFSGVKKLKEETKAILAKDGQITNLAGRTRRFPKPGDKYELFKQQRQAYNFLIQGVAAEACNRAYYRFHNFLKGNVVGRGLFSVHDEIVAEVHDSYHVYDTAMSMLVTIMGKSTNDFNFKYPLKAKSYGPLEKWEKT